VSIDGLNVIEYPDALVVRTVVMCVYIIWNTEILTAVGSVTILLCRWLIYPEANLMS